MEQVKITPRFCEERMHHFYCDGCCKYLGQSLEYDDGWYEEIGKFELQCYIDSRYILHKHLCKKCVGKLLLEIERDLRRLGFKTEKEIEMEEEE